ELAWRRSIGVSCCSWGLSRPFPLLWANLKVCLTRLLCLKAADMMDRAGNKTAQGEIAMIKVAAPLMALKVIDDAIQAFGGAGVSDDVGLARSYAAIRTLRLADGPDEVHRRAIARLELKKHK
ncbi:MAG TPA: acyl-CoA dehydrogenase family protein, partial [Sphingomicrobium sp.]|nr:acyl-CoA dehydrogenase family protein [Sphingomicrobium sp.]